MEGKELFVKDVKKILNIITVPLIISNDNVFFWNSSASAFLKRHSISLDKTTLSNFKGNNKFFILDTAEASRKIIIYTFCVNNSSSNSWQIYLLLSSEDIENGFLKKLPLFNKIVKDFESIIENTYDGLYITDGLANTLRVNKAYERITGIKREEVVGKNMKDLVKSGFYNRSVSLEVIEKKSNVTIMQEVRTGKKVLVTGSPIFDEKGEIELVVTNVRDITELIELQHILHERTLEINCYKEELSRLKTLYQNNKEYIANSKVMNQIIEMALKVSKFDSNVLITGESGVGKGFIAKLIHKTSLRSAYPFIKINCAAIPENLFESELFGYEPGAFTGAGISGKKGLLEIANKGTIFLDEIGDLPFNLQSKLLQVIEEKEMRRVGSTKPISLDIRIISATNQDLKEMIKNKKFRQDLFYRLSTVSIHIPPLRERKEDILPLINYFLEQLNKKYRMKKYFSSEALQSLLVLEFQGNVRELSNIVEQAFLISEDEEITLKDIPQEFQLIRPISDIISGSLKDTMENMERRILKQAVENFGGIRKAAKELKISPSSISRKLKKA